MLTNKKFIFVLVFIILIVYIFFTRFSFNRIVSGSMEPTLMTFDITIGDKNAYNSSTIQRGDIISFYSNEEQEILGKRVIGLPKDHISFQDGYVFVNGQKLDESNYLPDTVVTICSDEFYVPENYLFVLGDNRTNSFDSRFFEDPYISESSILSKTVLVVPTHILVNFFQNLPGVLIIIILLVPLLIILLYEHFHYRRHRNTIPHTSAHLFKNLLDTIVAYIAVVLFLYVILFGENLNKVIVILVLCALYNIISTRFDA